VSRDAFSQSVCSQCCTETVDGVERLGGGPLACLCCAARGECRAAVSAQRLAALEPALRAAAAASRVDAELLRLVAALALALQEEQATPSGTVPAAKPAAKPVAKPAVVRASAADVATLQPAPVPPSVRAAAVATARALPELRPASGGDAGEWLASLAALLNGNAHGLGGDAAGGGADCAVGLFPYLSMFNHSCAPNAAFAAASPAAAGGGGGGTVMAVRALREVPAGAELCVAYVDTLAPRSLRIAATMETKGFRCACERCSVPLAESSDRLLEGGACGCCPEVTLPPPANSVAAGAAREWLCCGCGRGDGGAGAAAAAGAASALEAAMFAYRQPGGKAVAEPLLSDILSRFSPLLALHHASLFDCRTPLLNCARARRDLPAAAAQCSAILTTLEKMGGSEAERGRFWASLGEVLALRAAESGAQAKVWRAKAKDAFAKAAALRALCLGAEHPLTQAMEHEAAQFNTRK